MAFYPVFAINLSKDSLWQVAVEDNILFPGRWFVGSLMNKVNCASRNFGWRKLCFRDYNPMYVVF